MDPKIGIHGFNEFQINESVRRRLIQAGAKANMPIVIDPVGEVLAEALEKAKKRESEIVGPRPRNRAERRRIKHGKRK